MTEIAETVNILSAHRRNGAPRSVHHPQISLSNGVQFKIAIVRIVVVIVGIILLSGSG
ncbi:MAG TPA: hypothetical protein VLZ81_02705 [Blastocatellia bacterium]|nr:hypothetical protein [Blastocatellia bacterium]